MTWKLGWLKKTQLSGNGKLTQKLVNTKWFAKLRFLHRLLLEVHTQIFGNMGQEVFVFAAFKKANSETSSSGGNVKVSQISTNMMKMCLVLLLKGGKKYIA